MTDETSETQNQDDLRRCASGKPAEFGDDTDAEQTSVADSRIQRRVAVFSQTDGEKVLAARLSLVPDEAGPQLRLEGEPGDSMAAVQRVIENIGQGPIDPGIAGKSEAEKWDRLLDVLKAEGFGVEDISAGDYQIKFEINLQSGHHVAAQSALHGFALPNDPLARNVASAIAGAFRKMSDDAADDIKQAVAAGEQTRIVEAFRRVRASGALGVRPTQALLEATFSFDPTTLPDDDRRVVRECRLMTAHLSGRWDLAGPEAEAFMREEAARLDDRQKADLSMIIANGKVQQGHRETALHIWRKLLKSPEVLGAGNRGWAWRNVALASESDNSAACHAAKCSADAFLEAGEKDEAARSLMTLANRLLGEEPEAALKIIGDIFELIEREGLKSRELRAATHHARANRLVQIRRYAEAATDAKAAADLLRGLLGIEDRLISSLHLAAIAAGSAGDADSAKALKEEADRITNDIQSPHFLLARRIDELMQDYDSARADTLLRDAEEQKNHDAAVSIRVLQATRDSGKSDDEKLSLLEDALQKIEEGPGSRSLRELVQLALAGELARIGEAERSEERYRQVLVANPFHTQARQALVQSLWHRGQWGDAAVVIKRQIDLLGPMPGFCYAYGRSLFESGNYSGAVSAFTDALRLANGDANLIKHATELREQALQRGGTIEPKVVDTHPSRAVTREEFEKALDLFRNFISADKRMEFWTKIGKKRAWISRPERHAQSLLDTFLKGIFLERINVFKELDSGAGRLDLYVQLQGGLTAILELKMCGGGYSSNYAASGETQLIHYMENRDSKLGYLVVFDARARDFGKVFLSGGNSLTIITKTVDVRPEVGTPKPSS